jgi:DNA repair protein RecO (recombination protein O)
MKQVRTRGIILTRVNYGEADRIITFLTPDQGKVTAIAKAVRKAKSKLAGGIELFSVSDIGYIVGKSEINTLISTRLIKYYANIVKDTERTAIGYDVIKITNKATEDNPEAGYFDLIEEIFKALDDETVQPAVVRLWYDMHLLKLSGHGPNLTTDNKGQKLSPDSKYDFHIDQMGFVRPEGRQGSFNADQIKFLRLGFAAERPRLLQRVNDVDKLTNSTKQLVESMLVNHVRV